MKQFDIEKFEEYKINNTANYNLEDGTIVKLIDSGDTFREIRKSPNSPNSTNFTFYKSNMNLKEGGSFFYNNPIGVFNTYDQDGNLINQVNYDSPYTFAVSDLIDMMSANYQINLMTPSIKLSVHRYIEQDTNSPIYEIIYPIDDQSFRHFKINGNNGQIISDSTGHYIE